MIRDLPASVRQRLLNRSRETKRPFQELLAHYAMERFLYRLGQSPYVDRFVLKGALMFNVWSVGTSRPTKDIDLLARTENSVDVIVAVIQEICSQPVESDGLMFDVGSVTGVTIKEDAEYPGVRVTFRVTLKSARVSLQIYVGFGDVVTPRAAMTEYPVLLDFAAPRILGYSRETVVAEKFEAMTQRGLLNSRMKDFYDLLVLARQLDFDGETLHSAILRTFANRSTRIQAVPIALTAAFASDITKQTQWEGFLRKTKLDSAPLSLQNVIDELSPFLQPVAAAIQDSRSFAGRWLAPGPWQIT
jgi:predicted nucleotidyltransferase component of viral defense system